MSNNMAEAEQSDQNPSSPQRKSYNQNRAYSSYRGRGRGRPNPGVNKAIHLFGVKDLRDLLDRKHEQEQGRSGPPPDPSYNYLKDPSRENYNEYQAHGSHKDQYQERPHRDVQLNRQTSRGSFRGRGRGSNFPRERRHSESDKHTFIQNPVNIKIEVVASTGVRSYTFDEDKKLPDIKHVPNYNPKDPKSSRSENSRGRGYTENFRNDRGRGRGRGQYRRGRGRGGRGRGKPHGNKNEENAANHQSNPETSEEYTEEIFKSTDSTVENVVESEEKNEVLPENETADQEEHENDYPEEYYEDENEEYQETIEQTPLAEGPSDADINLNESLVITASENDEKSKRSVKFKIEEDGKVSKKDGEKKETDATCESKIDVQK